MPEIVRDHMHHTWVIIAPDRAGRPRDIRVSTRDHDAGPCPFCPGHESETPPEVLALGRPPDVAPDRPPWRVRVVPNRYPAVMAPAGGHEVIIATAEHARALADLTAGEMAELLTVARARLVALAEAPAVAAVQFFANVGAAAGASLRHAHAQVLALPIVPPLLRSELAAMRRWRAERGTCLVCDESAAAGERSVAGNARVVAIAPAASRYAWELRLAPRDHHERFEAASSDLLDDLATLLVSVLGALRTAAGDPAYNLVLHSAPAAADDFHWHLELTPRFSPLAGFEVGSGCFINSLSPEHAAAQLRRAGLTNPERRTA
ncbi:MAG: DUF4921 family protein [Candidatus Krumholzibacteriia bacterium]